jgi:hypothetical protein
MSGYLTVIMVAEPEIIFVGVNNKRTAPEIGCLDTG